MKTYLAWLGSDSRKANGIPGTWHGNPLRTACLLWVCLVLVAHAVAQAQLIDPISKLDPGPASSHATYSFAIQNAHIADVLALVRDKTKIPLCFESEELDPKTQGITASELLKSLKDSGGDRTLIQTMAEVAKNSPNAIADWRTPRFNFIFEKESIAGILQEVAGKFSNYEFRFENTYLVVTPKPSILSVVVKRVDTEKTTLQAALKALELILKERKITVMGPWMGSATRANALQAEVSKVADADASLSVVLTQLCQASSPRATWTVQGMKGSRTLTFMPVVDQEVR